MQDYIKAVSSFNLDAAFPNMESHAYDFRVDKYEPNRVWFTIRNSGTHTGPLKFLGRTIQPTGKVCSCWTAHVRESPHQTQQPASAALGALSTVGCLLDKLCNVSRVLCTCQLPCNKLMCIVSAAKGTLDVQVVLGAPECLSYTFSADGKVTSFTGALLNPSLQMKVTWWFCMPRSITVYVQVDPGIF